MKTKRHTLNVMTERRSKSSDTGLSSSLLRGFEILEFLATQHSRSSLRSMAATLGTGSSTLHRYLATLRDLGYVQRSPGGGHYELTLKVAWLASRVLDSLELPRIARSHMEKLTASTNETTHLGVLDGMEVAYVAKVDGNQAVKMRSRVGSRVALHSTSVGKAMLAFLPSEERDGMISKLEFTPLTPRTNRSPTKLAKELVLVRERGYAIDDEENEIGIRCIGAPVFDHNGHVVGAISLSGWTVTMTQDRVKSLGPQVKGTALSVSKELGFRTDGAE